MGVSYSAGTLIRTGAERATLVRRTYSLVFAGILVTMFGVALADSQPQILGFSVQHPIILLLVTFAPLFMAQRTARTFPANVGFTFLFNLLMGVMVAPVLVYAERTQPGITANAALLTGGAFAALTGYAFVSRRDFSAWGGFFFVGLIVVLLTSVLSMFFFPTEAAALWIAAATVLVFSGLLVFDTWRVRNVYGPDDYIPAAINIYLDLLNLFMALLRIFGGGNRRS